MTPAADRPLLQIMLIDDDPAFRSGLRIWLESFPDLNIVAEADNGTRALQILESLLPVDSVPPGQPGTADSGLDLVILAIELGRSDTQQMQGFELCRRIKAQYPTVAVLLLSVSPEPVLLAAAQRVGANGYCARGINANDLVAIIRHVANGQPYWMSFRNQESGRTALAESPSRNQGQSQIQSPQDARFNIAPRRSSLRWGIDRLRRNLRSSGIQQINGALAEIEAQLRNLDLSDLDRAILAGRQRELRASRWLVNRLLATQEPEEADLQRQQSAESPQFTVPPTPTPALSPVPAETPRQSSAITLSSATETLRQPTALVATARELQSVLFDAISAKLQTSLTNGTEIALETDILREDKKRELFYLVLRKLEDLLDELRHSQVDIEQVEAKRSLILLDLWQAVIIDFFGKYATLQVNGFAVEIVDELLQDMAIVQRAILDRIPGAVDLLNHLLFQTPLVIDGASYPPGNPAALARAELLLENLMIQVANAVMQPLLNRFANVEAVKQSLYDRRLLSSREIERFRNDLSWQYRLARYVRDPKDIFESQYRLFVLSGRGIRKTSIYASRAEELQQLSGIPLVVTIALETRDAVAPRLRSVVSFVGNGLVYVLTEVVGRGIGLIGRGVIKGIGNVWQDGRFNRR